MSAKKIKHEAESKRYLYFLVILKFLEKSVCPEEKIGSLLKHTHNATNFAVVELQFFFGGKARRLCAFKQNAGLLESLTASQPAKQTNNLSLMSSRLFLPYFHLARCIKKVCLQKTTDRGL